MTDTTSPNPPAASEAGCPVLGDGAARRGAESENPAIGSPAPHAGGRPRTNQDWWPNQLDLSVLHANGPASNPMDAGFRYADEVAALNVEAVKADVIDVLRTSQDWWPADFGHYGGLMVRLSWHSAGTYRIHDGRGGAGHGAQRFAPLNSWPDNVSLDKARRLLWPVKKKYGRALSWADLIVLAGNVALEDMGFETFGFAFGRDDIWEPDEVYWGPEDTWLGDARYTGQRDLDNPLGAVQMGLIYVNPEGPNGNPDPLASAIDIRETFARMAMNDEETVALIAGGHTFGKTHGAGPADNVGPEPEAAPLEDQGLGWRSSFRSGKGPDTITSGLEVTWTYHPTRWDNEFFHILFAYEWELFASPAGAQQWRPKNNGGADLTQEAFGDGRREPRMLTSDLALRFDPIYGPISRRFHDHPEEFAAAFAKAWYKLLHRDMGPVSRLIGPWVPEAQLWQDPVPAPAAEQVSEQDIASLKASILASGLTVAQLVRTAWASAASFRRTDLRGGANGARIRLEPQRSWEVNEPEELAAVLSVLEGIQATFNAGPRAVSLADLIVLGGAAAVEQAAAAAGVQIAVPFRPGRTDATAETTDADSFAVLEPRADGFRNYARPGEKLPLEKLLVDRAFMLGLSAPQMTVLVGGLRALGVTAPGSSLGVLTDRPGTLSTDFFVNLLAPGREWVATATEFVYEIRDADTGEPTWTATANDLIFGSNSQLRALAEVYASDDATQKFVADFVAAWTRVMDNDRFDLPRD